MQVIASGIMLAPGKNSTERRILEALDR